MQLGPRISARVLNAVALIDQRLRSDTVRLLPQRLRDRAGVQAGSRLYRRRDGVREGERAGPRLRQDAGHLRPGRHARSAPRDDGCSGDYRRRAGRPHGVRGPGALLDGRDMADRANRTAAAQPVSRRPTSSVTWPSDSRSRSSRVPTARCAWPASRTRGRRTRTSGRASITGRTFETSQNGADLSAAIGSFREATRDHPTFALAFYRLGLALQRDGQPAAAEEALRDEPADQREPRPRVPGAGVHALQSPMQYLAVLPGARRGAAHDRCRRSKRRRRTVTRRRRCGSTSSIGRRTPCRTPTGPPPSTGCAISRWTPRSPRSSGATHAIVSDASPTTTAERAEHLYAALPAAEQQTAPIKEAEASVLNALGRVLTRNFTL